MVVLRVMPLTSCGCNTMTEIITNNPKTKEKTNKQTNKQTPFKTGFSGDIMLFSSYFLLSLLGRSQANAEMGVEKEQVIEDELHRVLVYYPGAFFLHLMPRHPGGKLMKKERCPSGKDWERGYRSATFSVDCERSQADQFAGQFSQNQMPKIPAVFTDLCQSA